MKVLPNGNHKFIARTRLANDGGSIADMLNIQFKTDEYILAVRGEQFAFGTSEKLIQEGTIVRDGNDRAFDLVVDGEVLLRYTWPFGGKIGNSMIKIEGDFDLTPDYVDPCQFSPAPPFCK